MQVIRFSSFAKTKVTRLVRLGLYLLGLAVVLGLGAWLYLPWRLYLMLGAFLAFVRATAYFNAALNPWFGNKGEDRLEETLASLDDRYLLVRNWVPVVGEKSRGDIDFLLLGPHGALVIEVKTFSVATKCDGDKWQIQRPNGSWRWIKSPSRQLSGNVNVVAKLLKIRAHGALVFNDRADLKTCSPTVTVVRRKQLLETIHSLPEAGHKAEALWSRLAQPSAPSPATLET